MRRGWWQQRRSWMKAWGGGQGWNQPGASRQWKPLEVRTSTLALLLSAFSLGVQGELCQQRPAPTSGLSSASSAPRLQEKVCLGVGGGDWQEERAELVLKTSQRPLCNLSLSPPTTLTRTPGFHFFHKAMGSERVSDLPKITQAGDGRVGSS